MLFFVSIANDKPALQFFNGRDQCVAEIDAAIEGAARDEIVSLMKSGKLRGLVCGYQSSSKLDFAEEHGIYYDPHQMLKDAVNAHFA
jgi:hypothetical protein